MEESDRSPLERKLVFSLKMLWNILMFQRLILPTLLKTLNLLALLSALCMTIVHLFGGIPLIIPLIWMYVIAIRIASELVLLGYDFLIQRTQNK
jgi:hypothetical protein